MPMPLHVFEPRYVQMVADSLEGDRVIGMVLLEAGLGARLRGPAAGLPRGLRRAHRAEREAAGRPLQHRPARDLALPHRLRARAASPTGWPRSRPSKTGSRTRPARGDAAEGARGHRPGRRRPVRPRPPERAAPRRLRERPVPDPGPLAGGAAVPARLRLDPRALRAPRSRSSSSSASSRSSATARSSTSPDYSEVHLTGFVNSPISARVRAARASLAPFPRFPVLRCAPDEQRLPLREKPWRWSGSLSC